jgi:hypothetical protein
VWRTWFVWHNIIIYWIMYEYESYKNMYLNNIFETWLLYLISFMKCDCCIVYFCFFWQNYYILISKLLLFFFFVTHWYKIFIATMTIINREICRTYMASLSLTSKFFPYACVKNQTLKYIMIMVTWIFLLEI